jgi:plasmid stability protein
MAKPKEGPKGFGEAAKKWKGKPSSENPLDLVSPVERKVLSPEAQVALQRIREKWGVRDTSRRRSRGEGSVKNEQMTTLTIRSFPAELHDRLRKQAEANGRSMEAEARSILARALAHPRLSVEETTRQVHAIMAKAPKRKTKKLLSEEFLEERRAMWGEE